MAIKGKTRKRGGGRGRALPPKPVIVERKPPFLMRKPVRRTIVAVVAVAAILGALRIWQNVGRSHALATYDRKLTRVIGQGSLLALHLDPNSGMAQSAASFASGSITASQFLQLAQQWESDFNTVKTNLAALKPPKQLGDGQQLMLQGIDGYIGSARLEQVAARQQQLADSTTAKAKAQKDVAFKKILNDQAKAERDQGQLLLIHADEERQRGEALFRLGQAKLEALKAAWGLPAPAPSASNLQIPQQ